MSDDRRRSHAGDTEPMDDLTGVPAIPTVALAPDGEACAYTYGRYLLDLYLVEGLRP